LKVDFYTLPLSVDVLKVLTLFTKLDHAFTPNLLLLKPDAIKELTPVVKRQLEVLASSLSEEPLWAREYLDATSLHPQDESDVSEVS
jgi:hypothetical protein